MYFHTLMSHVYRETEAALGGVYFATQSCLLSTTSDVKLCVKKVRLTEVPASNVIYQFTFGYGDVYINITNR